MPFVYDRSYELEFEVEDNRANEGRYVMPPGSTTTGIELRKAAARERERKLQELEFERQTRPNYMHFDVDLNNIYDIEAVISVLQARASILRNTNIIIPHPRQY